MPTQEFKRFKREHMPVCEVGTMPTRTCDYCATDAAWFHFGDKRNVDRDCYACDSHVGLLNPHFG